MQLTDIMRRICPASLICSASIAGASGFNSGQTRHTAVVKLVLAASRLAFKLHTHTHTHTWTFRSGMQKEKDLSALVRIAENLFLHTR